MGLLIIDGPESSGKSTLIQTILDVLHEDENIVRRWGPVSSWSKYIKPLYEDVDLILGLRAGDMSTTRIWDRSWAAEIVYNSLMNRGRIISESSLTRHLENPVVDTGGLLVMLTCQPDVLSERRSMKAEAGHKDLPVEPKDEVREFTAYAEWHGWTIFDTTTETPEDVAETILAILEENERRLT